MLGFTHLEESAELEDIKDCFTGILESLSDKD
jgi:hypothetical protein